MAMNEDTALSRPKSTMGGWIKAAVAIGILLVLAYGFWTQRSMESDAVRQLGKPSGFTPP